MSRIPPTKVGDIAFPTNNNGKLYTAALIPVDATGVIKKSNPKARFLLNPGSYRETSSANWIGHNVPMQSRPVYQYSSGGPRIVTFESLVTRDSVHFGKNENGFIENLVDNALNVVGDIASQFAGVSLPPVNDLFSQPGPEQGTQLSVADYLMFYRSLLHPTYAEGYTNIVSSPPLVVLAVGRSFSDVAPADNVVGAGGPNVPYVPIWMVKNLDINITKMLPNGDPMEAKVTFTLEEYAIRPISGGNFIAQEPVSGGGSDLGGLISDAIGGLF